VKKEMNSIEWQWKQLDIYYRSKENAERIEPFVQMEKKYSLLAKQYPDAFKELYAQVMQAAHHREYAKGGEYLHRGFYSPSSLHIITGGVTRGRLLKRPPREKNYDYEYIFDEKGNLICSKVQGRTEILIHKENYVLGVEFNPRYVWDIERISECWYEDTKLVKYVCALPDCSSEKALCTEVNVETFEYANDLLEKVHWYRFAPTIKSLTHNEITLFRDEAGNLKEYSVEELDRPPFLETLPMADLRHKPRKNEIVFHDTHRNVK